MAAEGSIIRPYALSIPMFSRKKCYHHKMDKALKRGTEIITICAHQSLDCLISD